MHDTTPAPTPPPRRLTPPPSQALPLWASLPTDPRQQLSDLLGQLLARLHEARRAREVGRD